jgi:hypothetical protein
MYRTTQVSTRSGSRRFPCFKQMELYLERGRYPASWFQIACACLFYIRWKRHRSHLVLPGTHSIVFTELPFAKSPEYFKFFCKFSRFTSMSSVYAVHSQIIPLRTGRSQVITTPRSPVPFVHPNQVASSLPSLFAVNHLPTSDEIHHPIPSRAQTSRVS